MIQESGSQRGVQGLTVFVAGESGNGAAAVAQEGKHALQLGGDRFRLSSQGFLHLGQELVVFNVVGIAVQAEQVVLDA